jgi:hypothetical protein
MTLAEWVSLGIYVAWPMAIWAVWINGIFALQVLGYMKGDPGPGYIYVAAVALGLSVSWIAIH